MDIMLMIIGIIVGICILAATIMNLVITTMKNEGMLKAQIEASKVKRTDHINTLPYDSIVKIINELIGFYISDFVLIKGLDLKKQDELSIAIDSILTEVCVSVYNAMSNELKQAFLNYATEDHLKMVIKDNARIVLVAKLKK